LFCSRRLKRAAAGIHMRVIVAERIAQFCSFLGSVARQHKIGDRTRVQHIQNAVRSRARRSAAAVLAESRSAFARGPGYGYAGYSHARHHRGLMSRRVWMRTGRGTMNRASQVTGGGDK